MDQELLERLDSPADLRALQETDLPRVAAELRAYMLASVARTGGHLSAGLGTVELAVALHYVYDTPRDAIVWDVGHQAYPHKILTGRRTQLDAIRKRGGISGFLRRDESDYDAFGAGHSSTSISAALGMAAAERQVGGTARAVAVIGDGGLTAGLAFEALDHAGSLDTDLLVILNDNGMSISENVGALAQRMGKSPHGRLDELAGFFAALGFDYTGPCDGHDVISLVAQLRRMRSRPGPKLLHVLTQKGRGYAPAEAEPIRYHGVTAFDPTQGLLASKASAPTYTQVFGEWACETAARDPRLVVITPAMREGSGLVEFARRFPDRCFDVGIAEQHAVTFAAGLAARGLRPVVAIYSTFLQRAYDQLVHDVCLQKLPVMFAVDRAGLVGPDGATHNGTLDLSFARCIPELAVMTPANARQLRAMLDTGLAHAGASMVRYPRTAASGAAVRALPADLPETLQLGRAHLQRRGSGIALLAFGTLLEPAFELADIIDATVVDMRFVKPLDRQLIKEIAGQHELLVTLEENAIAGGAGAAVSEYLAEIGAETPILHLGLPDHPIEHGTRDECLREAGLDVPGIFDSIARFSAQLPDLRPSMRRELSLRRNAMFNGVTRSLARARTR